jgi:uncharacterized Fe-S center protein
MKSRVIFTPIHTVEKLGFSKTIHLMMREAGLLNIYQSGDLVAVKLHFGEKGNQPPIPPEQVRVFTEFIRKQGAEPFLTDTCVLYKSQRDNAVKYLRLIQNFGFTPGKTGAPVIIADGLTGNNETEIKIPGQIFNRVSIAAVAAQSTGLMVLSHVTGHLGAGMGAAIKNLGMGFASRKGKLRQHSGMKPHVSPADCTGCQVCLTWCPANAISMQGKVAEIDQEKCIGCGECLTVCRYYAVKHDWRTGSHELQRRIAEHALGVVITKRNKAAYFNFLTSITKDCDCIGKKQRPLISDIGLCVSNDPVAIDAISLDLIRDRAGKPLNEMAYPIDPWEQIRHGEKIGLGSSKYEMVTFKDD